MYHAMLLEKMNVCESVYVYFVCLEEEITIDL